MSFVSEESDSHLAEVRRRHRIQEARFHSLMSRSNSADRPQEPVQSHRSRSQCKEENGQHTASVVPSSRYAPASASIPYHRIQQQNGLSSEIGVIQCGKDEFQAYDNELSQLYVDIDREMQQEYKEKSTKEFDSTAVSMSSVDNPQEKSPVDAVTGQWHEEQGHEQGFEENGRHQSRKKPTSRLNKNDKEGTLDISLIDPESSEFDNNPLLQRNIRSMGNRNYGNYGNYGSPQQNSSSSGPASADSSDKYVSIVNDTGNVPSMRSVNGANSCVESNGNRIEVFEDHLCRTSSQMDSLRRSLEEQLKRVASLEVALESHDIHLTSYRTEQLAMAHKAVGEIQDTELTSKNDRNHMKRLIRTLLKGNAELEKRYKAEKLRNARAVIEMEEEKRKLLREVAVNGHGAHLGEISRNSDDSVNGNKSKEIKDLEIGAKPLSDTSTGSSIPDTDHSSHHLDHEYDDHLSNYRQYWRDIILGVNDGLISTFLLVATVAGGGLSTPDILLTAVAGAVAGAVSMGAGEYIATKAQNEVRAGEIALETEHVKNHNKSELRQVNDLLVIIGVTEEQKDIQKRLLKHYKNNPDALLKIMIALELGFIEEEKRSPIMTGLASCCLFLIGSIPSVIPFAFTTADPMLCLITAAAATSAALFVVGSIKTWATRGNCVHAVLENVIMAGVGGGLAYSVGLGFDQLVNGE